MSRIHFIQYSFKAGEDLAEGDVVKLTSTGLVKAADNEESKNILGVVLKGGKSGEEVTVKMKKEVFQIEKESGASLNVGDEFGIKGGKAAEVDGTTVTNAVGKVVKTYSTNVVDVIFY